MKHTRFTPYVILSVHNGFRHMLNTQIQIYIAEVEGIVCEYSIKCTIYYMYECVVHHDSRAIYLKRFVTSSFLDK